MNVTARRPDTLTSKSADSNGSALGNGANGHLYHQTVIQSKKDHPVTEVTYTRACDLQSKKLSVKVWYYKLTNSANSPSILVLVLFIFVAGSWTETSFGEREWNRGGKAS